MASMSTSTFTTFLTSTIYHTSTSTSSRVSSPTPFDTHNSHPIKHNGSGKVGAVSAGTLALILLGISAALLFIGYMVRKHCYPARRQWEHQHRQQLNARRQTSQRPVCAIAGQSTGNPYLLDYTPATPMRDQQRRHTWPKAAAYYAQNRSEQFWYNTRNGSGSGRRAQLPQMWVENSDIEMQAVENTRGGSRQENQRLQRGDGRSGIETPPPAYLLREGGGARRGGRASSSVISEGNGGRRNFGGV